MLSPKKEASKIIAIVVAFALCLIVIFTAILYLYDGMNEIHMLSAMGTVLFGYILARTKLQV